MSQIVSKTSPAVSNVSRNQGGWQYFPWLYSFWKFSRPHTIAGTTMSVMGLYGIAIASSQIPLGSNLIQLFGTWLACLCGNIYIVGLNQLEDIAIDKINKPHLPLAAGEFSRRQAQIIVAFTGILAFVLSGLMGKFLWGMVSISLAIGTAYSLPPIRLKRFPFWAALCIFSVRGAIVNLGLFWHFQQKLSIAENTRLNWTVTPEVWVLTLFILVFTFAIAIFKDIPDLEGDRQYNITTFTIKLGVLAVFNLARSGLTICYLGMMASGFYLNEVNPVFLVSIHLLLLILMWWRSMKVDLHNKSAIASFYQFIWKLFFWEYLIFPLACLIP